MPLKPKPSLAAAAGAAAATPSVSVEDLFTTLARHTKDSDFPKAVKVADQSCRLSPPPILLRSAPIRSDLCLSFPFSVLAVVPGDEDALLCKVVGLIKSDDIDRAVRCIEGAQGLPLDLRYYKVIIIVSGFWVQ